MVHESYTRSIYSQSDVMFAGKSRVHVNDRVVRVTDKCTSYRLCNKPGCRQASASSETIVTHNIACSPYCCYCRPQRTILDNVRCAEQIHWKSSRVALGASEREPRSSKPLRVRIPAGHFDHLTTTLHQISDLHALRPPQTTSGSSYTSNSWQAAHGCQPALPLRHACLRGLPDRPRG